MKPLAVLIGDSIRCGYMQTVANLLGPEVDVRWPADNCGDTNCTLAHLGEWVIELKPDIVHVNCGLHDLKRDNPTGTHHVAPADYVENLRRIFTRIAAETSATAIWATTTPVIDARHNTVKPFRRHDADVELYNELAAGVAREFGVAVNDLCAAVRAAGPAELLSADGVHYTEAGQRFLGERVAACIRATAAGRRQGAGRDGVIR